MNGGPRKPFAGASSNGSASTLKRQLDFQKTTKPHKGHRDYSLPPIPDEDDDLLSHYASPKCNYDPLPVDLFPLPDSFQEEEMQNATRFPCFKYYDLTKYSLEEAQQLSAMDLIPKDALKKTDPNHMQRTKRSKRVTTEATHLAGYYRNKNEGVEILYGGKDGVSGGRLGAKTRRAQQLATQSQAGYSGNGNHVGASGPSSRPGDPSAPTPKKQGNRLDFLASLRRQMLPADKKPASFGYSSSSHRVHGGGRKQSARGGGMARRVTRLMPYQEQEEQEEDGDDDHISVHSTASSASTGDSTRDVTETKTELDDNATVGPAWVDGEDGRTGEIRSHVALAFIANEELGDSDDEGARF